MADRAARRVLEAWTDRLAPVAEDLARARWDAAASATDVHLARVVERERLLEATLRDEAGIGKVEQSLSERIDDPVLRRAHRRAGPGGGAP